MALDLPPSAHHHFKLVKDATSVPSNEGDHAGAVRLDLVDLQSVFLDVTVSGDDQPATPGDFRYPDPVLDRRGAGRTGRSLPLVDHFAWVTRIGDVRTQVGEYV